MRLFPELSLCFEVKFEVCFFLLFSGMSQRVAVLGGGISGLAAAWNLARKQPNLDILLLERSEKLGGWLQSHRGGVEEEGERGRVFELGPRSLRTAGVAGKTTLALVRRVHVSCFTYK